MKLYNTRTKKIEQLSPLDGKTIRVYSCGPTVYDHAHIGNLASFIFADTLRRVVGQVTSLPVRHVMNFTDVDDKTIARSHENYPKMDSMGALKALTSKYEQLFLIDMQKIGNDTDAFEFTKATDYIEKIQSLIAKLHKDGIAYIAEDGIYFNIAEYKKSHTYGQLVQINTDKTAEARINNDEYDKESAHDFALWKTQKKDEPAWGFELDGQKLDGRPGWHIECSVMSVDRLGQPFDIHTGGIDLAFPHHENEIAQSTAGEQPELYSNFFCHNEHVQVDGRKMSKSLNNFYVLEDIVKPAKDDPKPLDYLAFRLVVLQAHYRKQIDFSHESMRAAQNRLKHWREIADLQWQTRAATRKFGADFFAEQQQKIKDLLADDLNTPAALAYIDRTFTEFEIAGVNPAERSDLREFLNFIDQALGFNLAPSQDIDDDQKKDILARERAREQKDFKLADQLRDGLQEQGIGLRDTAGGPIWFRL